jgi:hypothetical protein
LIHFYLFLLPKNPLKFHLINILFLLIYLKILFVFLSLIMVFGEETMEKEINSYSLRLKEICFVLVLFHRLVHRRRCFVGSMDEKTKKICWKTMNILTELC